VKSSRRYAIVGTGRAGLGLARSLARTGRTVSAVVGRRAAGAARATRLMRRRVGTTDLAAGVAGASVVLLCVPDDRLAGLTRALARLPLAGKVLLHTSGAVSGDALAPLRVAGARVGSLHPLASFPAPGPKTPPPDLTGISFAVDGDPAAIREARAIARALGGRPITVAASDRGAYHLAASILANDLVSLLDAGLALAARSMNAPERRAREAMLPLVRACVENVGRTGARAALTGPVARGDLGTVARHLEILGREGPDLDRIHRALSCRAVAMALARGDLTAARARALRRLLGGPSRRRH